MLAGSGSGHSADFDSSAGASVDGKTGNDGAGVFFSGFPDLADFLGRGLEILCSGGDSPVEVAADSGVENSDALMDEQRKTVNPAAVEQIGRSRQAMLEIKFFLNPQTHGHIAFIRSGVPLSGFLQKPD